MSDLGWKEKSEYIKNPKFYDLFEQTGFYPENEINQDEVELPSLEWVDSHKPFNSKLLKVEYLITRACNLACIGCFEEDATIRMADRKTKKIKDIKVGDEIISYDGNNIISDRVTKIFNRESKCYYSITFEDGTVLPKVTEEHPIWVCQEKDYIKVSDLKIGYELLNIGANTDITSVRIQKIERVEELTKVFNFETEKTHTYFVVRQHEKDIQNAVLVHNCTMPTPATIRPELNKEAKKLVAHCMKVLKIPFTAIYGSEPTMLPVEELGEVVREFEEQGVYATIITNGMNLTEDYLDTLYTKYNLRSLTMSCDDLDIKKIKDPSTARKSDKTFKMLPYWHKKYVENGEARDSQLTITVHKYNVEILPEFVKWWTDQGIYVSLDFIHYNDRLGKPAPEGTKVADYKTAKALCFETDDDFLKLANSLEKVLRMKQDGATIWNSENSLLDMMTQTKDSMYTWRCNYQDFLAVDCDGTAWGCDDFQPRGYGKTMMLWDILTPENLQKMRHRNTDFMDISKHCDTCYGCEWQTHKEASRVMREGSVNLSHYVHGK